MDFHYKCIDITRDELNFTHNIPIQMLDQNRRVIGNDFYFRGKNASIYSEFEFV